MSKTGNSPLPRPPIHPQPNTNDGRQILDQQENVSHRCFPRRASRKTSPTRRAFKIEILKISGSALAAEICTGPHNRLLRRQHCSSLCSQSEGHEHVANMTNALGHDFVGFSVLVRHNIRPPHFASKVSYSASPQASAKCPRGAPCCDATLAMLFALKTAQIFFWILNTQPNAASTPCPVQCHPLLANSQVYPAFFAFPTGAFCRKINSPIHPLCQSANHVPDAGVSRPRCGRITSQMRTCLAPDADVSRPRRGRVSTQTR